MKEGNIVTAPFRLAFPQVFEAKASIEGGKEKFSITMLFPKDGSPLIPSLSKDNGIMAIRKLLTEAIKAKYGEDKAKWPAPFKGMDVKTVISMNGKDGWPVRDGDMVEWDGFEGNLFVRASTQFPIGVVDRKLQPVMNSSDVFGGLICRAEINAYCYDTNGNKGVTLGVNNLQILKDDGVVLGGKSRPEDSFEAFYDGDSSSTADDDF